MAHFLPNIQPASITTCLLGFRGMAGQQSEAWKQTGRGGTMGLPSAPLTLELSDRIWYLV